MGKASLETRGTTASSFLKNMDLYGKNSIKERAHVHRRLKVSLLPNFLLPLSQVFTRRTGSTALMESFPSTSPFSEHMYVWASCSRRVRMGSLNLLPQRSFGDSSLIGTAERVGRTSTVELSVNCTNPTFCLPTQTLLKVNTAVPRYRRVALTSQDGHSEKMQFYWLSFVLSGCSDCN